MRLLPSLSGMVTSSNRTTFRARGSPACWRVIVALESAASAAWRRLRVRDNREVTTSPVGCWPSSNVDCVPSSAARGTVLLLRRFCRKHVKHRSSNCICKGKLNKFLWNVLHVYTPVIIHSDQYIFDSDSIMDIHSCMELNIIIGRSTILGILTLFPSVV